MCVCVFCSVCVYVHKCDWFIYLSFVNYGIVWACIYYMYTQLIVSEAYALAHRVYPEGQRTSALPSLTPCRMLFFSSSVTGFSGPHVCPEMDQVENSNPSRLPWPPPHPPRTSVQCQSFTCCFTSDTNTWEKDGAHLDHGKLLFCAGGFCFLTSLFSCKHCHPLKLSSSVSSGLTCSEVHLPLFLSFSSLLCLFQGGNTPVVLTNLVPFK